MFQLAVIATFVICSIAFDMRCLKQTPPEMLYFDIIKWTGTWYFQVRVTPCSWGGSADFTNVERDITFDGHNVLSSVTWRSGDTCVRGVTLNKTITGPGCYIQRDTIGNVLSGTTMVVDMDPKHFTIQWGCTKYEAFGKICDDPFMNIQTRHLIRSPYTWRKINRSLWKLWGMNMNDLLTYRVKQNHSCNPTRKNGIIKRFRKLY